MPTWLANILTFLGFLISISVSIYREDIKIFINKFIKNAFVIKGKQQIPIISEDKNHSIFINNTRLIEKETLFEISSPQKINKFKRPSNTNISIAVTKNSKSIVVIIPRLRTDFIDFIGICIRKIAYVFIVGYFFFGNSQR